MSRRVGLWAALCVGPQWGVVGLDVSHSNMSFYQLYNHPYIELEENLVGDNMKQCLKGYYQIKPKAVM